MVHIILQQVMIATNGEFSARKVIRKSLSKQQLFKIFKTKRKPRFPEFERIIVQCRTNSVKYT